MYTHIVHLRAFIWNNAPIVSETKRFFNVLEYVSVKRFILSVTYARDEAF